MASRGRARASARRSSSRRCRISCICATPAATPCCIPRSRIRPTRWARRSRACARSRCRSTSTGTSTSTRSPTADAERALLLWLNEPGNPASQTADDGVLRARGRMGARPRRRRRERRVLRRVRARRRRRSSPAGIDGVLAVHSVSKRSNLAGMRVGFYAGDPELVLVSRRDAQARGVHGADAGASRSRGRARRRRARRRATGAVRRTPRRSCARALAGARPRARRRRRAVLSVAASPTPPTTAGRSRRGSRTAPACSCRRAISTARRGADHVRLALVQPRDRLELALDRLVRANRLTTHEDWDEMDDVAKQMTQLFEAGNDWRDVMPVGTGARRSP